MGRHSGAANGLGYALVGGVPLSNMTVLCGAIRAGGMTMFSGSTLATDGGAKTSQP
jgi:hypothetical protein